MAYQVEHLHSAQAVDDAIFHESESDRLAVVRFGRGGHDDCVRVDAAMAAAAEQVGPLAALVAVDIDEVQDFNVMYELRRPCTVMFFYGNRYVDVRGFHHPAGDNDWAAVTGADEFAAVVAVVHGRATVGFSFVDLAQP